jgi:hypothetical protein
VYAGINGLQMFCEIRGTSDPVKVPVVLLHGAAGSSPLTHGRHPRMGRTTSATLTVTSFMTGLIGRWLARSG